MDKPTKELLKKAMDMMEDARNIISAAAAEAREAFDDMSESKQESDKGEKLDGFATSLEELDSTLDEAAGLLGDLINNN